MTNGLPERKDFRATLITDDQNIYYANFKASDKSDAYEEFVNILLELDFLICEDETAIRCSTVIRFTIEAAPTLEERAEDAKRLINNYVSNYGYDYDLPLLLKVYNLNQDGKYMNDNTTLQSTVSCLFHELQTVSEYNESLEGK